MAGESVRVVGRPLVYCIVPRALAGKLHDVLREHWRDEPSVRVVVERRGRERRGSSRRSPVEGDAKILEERRRTRHSDGRRVADRRALSIPVGSLPLPRRARRYAGALEFVEWLEPPDQQRKEEDSHRLVLRFQAGDDSAIDELYMRYFDEVYLYAKVALREHHEAEDVTQQVFVRVIAGLGRYELRPGKPFRAWLFRVARNAILDSVARGRVVLPEAPDQIEGRIEESGEAAALPLDWLTDREVALFVERLPEAQRQVLVLRFMLDMATEEIAEVMERSASAVRQLQSRALRSLHARLTVVGREPSRGSRRAPMRVRMRPMPVMVRRRFALGGPRSPIAPAGR